jgi:hypothetical protein
VKIKDTPYTGAILRNEGGLYAVEMPQEAIDTGYKPVESMFIELYAKEEG